MKVKVWYERSYNRLYLSFDYDSSRNSDIILVLTNDDFLRITRRTEDKNGEIIKLSQPFCRRSRCAKTIYDPLIAFIREKEIEI